MEYGEAGFSPEEARESIERKAEEADPTVDPGWAQMSQTAEQARQENPQPWSQGDTIPTEDIPESERLDRPVGTESDSY